MFKRLKRLLPENNGIIRAYFYTVGFWGSVHMFAAILQAIHRHDATGLNALRIANIDAPVERAVDTPLFFVGGWVVFWLGYILIYQLIKPLRSARKAARDTSSADKAPPA